MRRIRSTHSLLVSMLYTSRSVLTNILAHFELALWSMANELSPALLAAADARALLSPSEKQREALERSIELIDGSELEPPNVNLKILHVWRA